MKRQAVFGLLTCVCIFVLHVPAAEAGRPQVQMPWRYNDARRINGGNTYNCDTHNVQGPGDWNAPQEWDYYAVDFDLNYPDKVASSDDGVVVQNKFISGYGYHIVIDHGGFYSVYAHLEVPGLPAVGTRVRAGEYIGDAGDSEVSSGDDHLHFQLGRGTAASNGVAAASPEPMSGRWNSGVDSGDSVGQEAFGNWGGNGCPGRDPTSDYWRSSSKLTDVLIYSSTSGNESVLMSHGYDGGVLTGQFDRVSGSWGSLWEVAVPGYFNSDGYADVFLSTGNTGTNPNSKLQWASGSGGWSVGPTAHFNLNGFDAYPGNFNADGLTDLWLYTGLQGSAWVEFANGSGGWSGVPTTFGPSWKVHTGNFNADNYTDILLYNPNAAQDPRAFLELADGQGGWAAYSWNVPANREMHIGYFNTDRLSDVLLIEDTAVDAKYLLRFANGSGNWTGLPSWQSLPGEWGRLTHVGYFDGAPTTQSSLKRADVLRYNPYLGYWTLHYSDGTGNLVSPQSGTWDTYDSLFPAYLNDDPLTDIIRYNGTRFQMMFRDTAAPQGWTGGAPDTCCAGYSVSDIHPSSYDKK